MGKQTIYQQETVILVELKPRHDIHTTTDVGILTPKNVAEKSSEALRKAMGIIKSMASRVVETVREIPISELPDETEVEFGLKLTTDANVLIVNAGTEAHFTVKMKWIRKVDSVVESEAAQSTSENYKVEG